MSRPTRALLALALVLASVAGAIGVGIGVWSSRAAPPPPLPLSDRLVATADELGSTGHRHVAPEMTGYFSASQLARIDAAMEAVPGDVVVVVRWPSMAAGEPTSTRMLAHSLGVELQRRALYVVIGPEAIDYVDVGQSGDHLSGPRLGEQPTPEAMVLALEADIEDFTDHTMVPDDDAWSYSNEVSSEAGSVVGAVVGALLLVLLPGLVLSWWRRRR